MELFNGTIEPGVRIGSCYIGAKREEVLSQFSNNYKIWERGDGFCIYTYDNLKLWFETNGKLQQIGVTKGFNGNYESIRIGSTMQDIVSRYGGYENDGDVYLIPDREGICFELEDVDDWDELTAPIEWIFVYAC